MNSAGMYLNWCIDHDLYTIYNAEVDKPKIFSIRLQHSYLKISLAFVQNWHLGALSDAMDNTCSSTITRSSTSECTWFAPEMVLSKPFITLPQRWPGTFWGRSKFDDADTDTPLPNTDLCSTRRRGCEGGHTVMMEVVWNECVGHFVSMSFQCWPYLHNM